MRGVHSFMFLVALPLLAALGHDIYLLITSGGVDAIQDTLQDSLHNTWNDGAGPGVKSLFATLGWIWTHYHLESYKWVVENTAPDSWAIINTILAQKAVAIGAAIAGFFYIILGILKILGTWPFNEQGMSAVTGNKRIDNVLNKGNKPGKFKYKRK